MDSSQSTMNFIAETVAGTTPATPAFKGVRITGETLVANFESQISNELSTNADVIDVRKTGLSTSGDINFELHADPNLEDLIAGALRGAWATDVLKAASLKPSFTLERKLAGDAATSYFRFTGSYFNGMSLNITPEEIITGSLRVTGIGHSTATAIIAGATYANPPLAASVAPMMVGMDVSAATVSGVTGVDFSALTIEVDNNNRIQRKLAAAGGQARGVGYGRRSITGTLTAYFETLDLYNAFRTDLAPSITATISDGTNNYTIVLPRVKFTGGEVPTPGIDQDIMLTMNYQALYNNATSTAMQITRV